MNIEQVNLEQIDLDALRANLKEAEVDFGGRSGPQRLFDLAIENEIEVPLIGGGVFEAADEDAEDESKNVIPEKYRKKYGKAQNCGDDVALVLKDFTTGLDDKGKTFLDLTKVHAVGDQNKVDYERWNHLNPGMQRMNLGNVLRARANRGDAISIGDRHWEAVEQDEENPDSASKMG